jgi:hypothetical protein
MHRGHICAKPLKPRQLSLVKQLQSRSSIRTSLRSLCVLHSGNPAQSPDSLSTKSTSRTKIGYSVSPRTYGLRGHTPPARILAHVHTSYDPIKSLPCRAFHRHSGPRLSGICDGRCMRNQPSSGQLSLAALVHLSYIHSPASEDDSATKILPQSHTAILVSAICDCDGCGMREHFVEV